MKIISNPSSGLWLRRAVRGIAIGVVLITVATVSAHADIKRDNDQRGEARDRDWRAHAERRHGYEPGVVYAPPVVYTAPQYEEQGFNLVIPLNIR